MRAKVHVDGFELVLYAYPNAIFEKCVHGSTPLHLTCQYRGSVETLELLVLPRHSCAASISGGPDGNLPIHVAIKNLDEHVIYLTLFLELHQPRHAIMRQLPLHFPCRRDDFSFELIKRLVDIYPEGLTIQENDG
jgi:hypothetical protein